MSAATGSIPGVIPASFNSGAGQAGIHFDLAFKARWIDSLLPRLALRAIRFANVRFGILPSQSAFAGVTSKRGSAE